MRDSGHFVSRASSIPPGIPLEIIIGDALAPLPLPPRSPLAPLWREVWPRFYRFHTWGYFAFFFRYLLFNYVSAAARLDAVLYSRCIYVLYIVRNMKVEESI